VPLLLLLFSYLCGSIPFGVLFARWAGVDVRRAGSGNIGAANVVRTAGARLGLLTLVADALKGALPALVAGRGASDPTLAAGAGLAAFAGHVFPVTLGFAGGKGVATALGVLAVLCPPALLCALVVFFVTFALYRYVSVASVLAALAAPAATGLLGYPVPYLGASLVMAGIIVVRHRDNLRRLLAGNEPRFALHKKQAPLPK